MTEQPLPTTTSVPAQALLWDAPAAAEAEGQMQRLVHEGYRFLSTCVWGADGSLRGYGVEVLAPDLRWLGYIAKVQD